MDPGVSKFTNRLNLKGYDVLYAAVLLIVTDHLSIWIERRQYRLCAVLLYNGLLLFFGAGLCAFACFFFLFCVFFFPWGEGEKNISFAPSFFLLVCFFFLGWGCGGLFF